MFNFAELQKSKASRRAFLTTMTAAGLGLAASRLLAMPGHNSSQKPEEPETRNARPSDFPGIPGRNINEKVLNFALTLEILEADLYRQALNYASGFKLDRALDSNAKIYGRHVTAGGLSSKSANVGFVYLRDFAYVEAAHRDFVRAAIQAAGGTPVSPNAKGYKFVKTPDATMEAILAAILPLEETGVRAYLGASRSLVDPTLVQTAGTIYSTEARHSAAVRFILGQNIGPVQMSGDKSEPANRTAQNAFEYYLEPSQVLTAAKPYFA